MGIIKWLKILRDVQQKYIEYNEESGSNLLKFGNSIIRVLITT